MSTPFSLDKTGLVEKIIFSDEPDFRSFEKITFEEGSYFEMDELLFTDEFVVPPTFQIVGTKIFCDLTRIYDWLSFISQFKFSHYSHSARATLDKYFVWRCSEELERIRI